MSKLRLRIAVSLDGFVAGSRQSVDNPLGIGGNRLHEWVYPLKAWRAPHGLEGGEANESNAVLEESQANIGATIMGRNMFGGQPGAWNGSSPWDGWWGDNPPPPHRIGRFGVPELPTTCSASSTSNAGALDRTSAGCWWRQVEALDHAAHASRQPK